MAEVNVENMEENAELFMEKMGFSHDSDGLEMSDDQLVNFAFGSVSVATLYLANRHQPAKIWFIME